MAIARNQAIVGLKMIDDSPRLPATRRVLALGAGAALLAACGPARRARDRIRIGYQKNGVLLFARARGVVDAAMRPFRIDWVEFASGPPLLAAMNAGKVDFGATGDTPPLFAQAAGAAIQYVAHQPLTGAGEAMIVPAGSDIRRLRDLRGRRIAFTRGSSAHLLAAHALAKGGLTLDEATPVDLDPAAAAEAFARRKVDAWAIWDPFLALAERDQRARILISGARLSRTDRFYLASDQLIADAPHDLVRLLNALQADAWWGHTHPADLIPLVSAASGLAPDIAATTLRRERPAVEPLVPEVLARLQADADLLADLGVLGRRIKVGDAVWSGWRGPASGT